MGIISFSPSNLVSTVVLQQVLTLQEAPPPESRHGV